MEKQLLSYKLQTGVLYHRQHLYSRALFSHFLTKSFKTFIFLHTYSILTIQSYKQLYCKQSLLCVEYHKTYYIA